MNEIQELEVAIDAHGRVTVQVRGVKGERCLALTQALEARLGTVVDRVATAEMDQADEQSSEAAETQGIRRD